MESYFILMALLFILDINCLKSQTTFLAQVSAQTKFLHSNSWNTKEKYKRSPEWPVIQ